MNRILGVLTLKSSVYREIAKDQSATTTAGIIVVAVALLSGILGAATISSTVALAPAGLQGFIPSSPIVFGLTLVIGTLVGWVVGSWIFAFVAKTFFGGKTEIGEMLRVFGYTSLFAILAIIPCCGAIVGLVLSVIGAIIGIREAGELSTGKAILTGIIGLIGIWVVQALVGLVIDLLPF